MAEFASHGVGNAALATGIIGTTLGVLNGGLGGLFGGYGRGHGECGHGGVVVDRGLYGCGTPYGMLGESTPTNRWDYCNLEKSSEKDAIIAALKSEKYTDNKIAALADKMEVKVDNLAIAVERRIDGVVAHTNAKFEQVEKCIGNQNVINAKLEGVVNCQESQIMSLTHRLNRVTKEVIPKDVIRPSVMPEFNSWTAPTTATE